MCVCVKIQVSQSIFCIYMMSITIMYYTMNYNYRILKTKHLNIISLRYIIGSYSVTTDIYMHAMSAILL